MTEADLTAVPHRLREGLLAYVNEHRRPGDFLRAVLENNLAWAVQVADPLSLGALEDLVLALIAAAPEECWGSEEAFVDWLGGCAGGHNLLASRR